MKIRMLALAGVAAVALSAPAHAEEGWYIGLGGGYDHANTIRTESVATGQFVPVGISSSGLIALSLGYGWDSGLRLEDEISYTSHGVESKSGFDGNASLASDMFNLMYDI